MWNHVLYLETLQKGAPFD
uniref:Uncharacterized protein n=1 Tax=Anguilla anguilla TaxID=7936 RepID=A0A0E9TID9_ANGAN